MPEAGSMALVRWSADVIDLGCEVHVADSCRSGWIDPGWDVFQVGPDRDTDSVPDVMPDDEDDPAQWLADTVARRMGVPDGCHHTDRPGAWRAADPIIDDGVESMLRAEAEGFTLAEMEAANQILLGRTLDDTCGCW